MTVETRYFTSNTITYKGISCRQLKITNSSSNESRGLLNGAIIGIRVWKSDASDTETEITSGTPVAITPYYEDGEETSTWICPLTTLVVTDKIIVRVYMSKLTPVLWVLIQNFVSEALGASSLDVATWTVHYEMVKSGFSLNFDYGNTDPWDSRITGFTWSTAIAETIQGDGLTFTT